MARSREDPLNVAEASHASNGHEDVLVGDIGGTHARFGIVDQAGRLEAVKIFNAADYATLTAAASEYLGALARRNRPRKGAIAVASPVLSDRVQLTNHPWSFSVEETRSALELETLEVLNDFIALALALPALKEEHSRTIKPGRRQATAPLGLLGPGTGLGVSALIPVAQGWVALPAEGGHRDLAASTEREWRIVRCLQERFGHVSAERILSGPGLLNLYQAICQLDGLVPEAEEPKEIEARALASGCRACTEAIAIFSRQLGAVAGDLALTFGARGGIFLGGGVLQGMGDAFQVGLFCEGFLDKGRFRSYLEPVPVRLVLNPTAALVGAARALEYEFPAGVRALPQDLSAGSLPP